MATTTDVKAVNQNAAAVLDAELTKAREPAVPQAPPWKGVSGIRSDGADAARRTLARAKR